jgi:PKD repeat protein
MIFRIKKQRFLAVSILTILISAVAAAFFIVSFKLVSANPGLLITTNTDKHTYLLRQKVNISGSITLDGSPANNLLVITQVTTPLSSTSLAYRTLQIGNVAQTWSVSISNIFITDSSGQQINTVKAGSSIRVGMNVNNLQANARAVYATITVFDANMVSVGTGFIKDTIDPMSTIGTILMFNVPKSATSGKATVVCDVFSDEPKNGGIALCLESTVYFWLSRTQQGTFQLPAVPPPSPQMTPGNYSTYVTLPWDVTVGNYQVYITGQASPAVTSSTQTAFSVQSSTGYPPQASFVYWPAQPILGTSVSFDASSSTPESFNGQITSYAWTFGDGGSATVTYTTTTHTYQQSGTLIVTLNVTNTDGLWSTTSKPIVILPEPLPQANFTWTPANPVVNDTTTFDASSSTSTRAITSYAWNFSDGTGIVIVSTATTTHTYTHSGSYNVNLTITDAIGRYSSIAKIVQVQNNTIKIYDITHDGVIDGSDLIIVTRAFGSSAGPPPSSNWNPIADITGDGTVDGSDIIPIARNYGKDP